MKKLTAVLLSAALGLTSAASFAATILVLSEIYSEMQEKVTQNCILQQRRPG